MQTEAETAKQFCQKVVDSENEYQVSVDFLTSDTFLVLLLKQDLLI